VVERRGRRITRRDGRVRVKLNIIWWVGKSVLDKE
jgi:hypothetical protein